MNKSFDKAKEAGSVRYLQAPYLVGAMGEGAGIDAVQAAVRGLVKGRRRAGWPVAGMAGTAHLLPPLGAGKDPAQPRW